MAKSLNQLCNLAVQNMTTFVNRSILCQIAPNVIENFQSLRREGPKSPFCLPSLLPLRCIGSRWNPVIIKLKDPLYPLRYHLSRLIQGIGSYLKTTTGCRTRCLKSSGLQSSQIFMLDFTHSQNIKYRFLIILHSYCRDRFSTYLVATICPLLKIKVTLYSERHLQKLLEIHKNSYRKYSN